MKLNAYTLLLSFLVLLSHASSCNQSSAYPGLDKQVNLRRSEMLSKAQQNPSNAGKEDYISSATVAQDDAAITFQSKVLTVLLPDAADAYKVERESFAAWYAYQQIISEEIIGDIWELYAGGSAGGSFQLIHLYDIGNANATEQEVLYNVLAGKSFPEICHENVSFPQIDSTKAQFCSEFRYLYSQHEDIGHNGWPAVKNTPGQLDAMLDTDLDLFKKWLFARDALEDFLDEGVSDLYASHTAFWRYLYQKNYQERFIGE